MIFICYTFYYFLFFLLCCAHKKKFYCLLLFNIVISDEEVLYIEHGYLPSIHLSFLWIQKWMMSGVWLGKLCFKFNPQIKNNVK